MTISSSKLNLKTMTIGALALTIFSWTSVHAADPGSVDCGESLTRAVPLYLTDQGTVGFYQSTEDRAKAAARQKALANIVAQETRYIKEIKYSNPLKRSCKSTCNEELSGEKSGLSDITYSNYVTSSQSGWWSGSVNVELRSKIFYHVSCLVKPTPTPTPTVTPAPSPTPTVVPSPTPSATPRVTPSPTPSVTPTPTPTVTPAPNGLCCKMPVNCRAENASTPYGEKYTSIQLTGSQNSCGLSYVGTRVNPIACSAVGALGACRATLNP